MPMPIGRPIYSLVDLIHELMGFDGSTKVVMTRQLAEDVIAELNRLYDIEDDYGRITAQIEQIKKEPG